MNTFDLKNASTQTWMPVHNKFRALPQSSHKDGSLSQKPACINRHYVVEADSVFDSEVSSKPHFPSSASNYTDSKTSDFLSSIREGEVTPICFTGPLEILVCSNIKNLPSYRLLARSGPRNKVLL